MSAISHPAWCQPDNCVNSGPDTTHAHLIGQAAGVELWIRRQDTVRADGSTMFGKVGIHIVSSGQQSVIDDVDDIDTLTALAGLFAAEVEGVR